MGYARKQQLRTAEPAGGRTAAQAMANLGVAALVVAVAPAGWPVLALAALAEAAADTGFSEIGMAFPGKTFLVTNFQTRSPQAPMAVSVFLERFQFCLGAATVACCRRAFRTGHLSLRPRSSFWQASSGLVDSLLGALFERRGWLDNDLVNLLSTAAAVGVAWGMG